MLPSNLKNESSMNQIVQLDGNDSLVSEISMNSENVSEMINYIPVIVTINVETQPDEAPVWFESYVPRPTIPPVRRPCL